MTHQFLAVRDLDPVDALHGHDVPGGVVPEHFRHVQQFAVLKVAAQLAGVGGLTRQIQFIKNNAFVFGHQVDRMQAPGALPDSLEEPGQPVHHPDYRGESSSRSRGAAP